MKEIPKIIIGGSHEDFRGTLRHFNELDLLPIKRFYISEHKDIITVKAWQAHKKERKWFYVLEGSFKIVLVKILNWDEPHLNSKHYEFIIKANDNKILCIPRGFATGFQALTNNSKLMIFSDFTLEESLADDFRFNKDLWYKW
jgi:dTDP-4-dehydrorhamnose 3,5-epimerase-like enzyme